MTTVSATLFGRLVREHRSRRGLTRRQLSQAASCAEVTLRKIEAGERRPSLQLAQALADALRLNPAERQIFMAEAREVSELPAQQAQTPDPFARVLALADDVSRRYSDEVQRRELDELEERVDEVRELLRALLRSDAQAAQHLAGALREFWIKRGHLAEGAGFLQQALLLDISATHDRAYALLAAGAIAAFQNDYSRAHRHLDECLALGERLALDDVQARVFQTKGWLALWGDGPQSASATFYAECMRLNERIGDHLRAAHVQCDLALAYLYGPEPDARRAECLAREGLARFEAAECGYGMAFALHALTQIKTAAGDLDEAERCEARALALFRQVGGQRDVAWSLAHLGDIALMRGRLEQARLYREESLGVFQAVGERNAVCVTLHALAQIAREAGDLRLAQRRLIAGLHLALEWDRPYVWVHGLYELAGVALALGAPRRAAELLGAADALAAQHGLSYPAHEAARFDEWRAAARSALGEVEFQIAREHGAGLNATRAAALAAETAA
jgi:transcriptional regulator with XRE-family HTH domain